jgi:hydroxyacylglutathione hydrolase
MAAVDVVPLVDEGLGNSAYLVDLGDGRALVVDVSRDLRAVRGAAARRGLRVAFAADTHLHADFLSGAHQLAATDGARALASAAGRREYPHMGLHDGDEVDLGGLRLRALLTPGHTHEHVAFLLLDGDREVGVFSGGSLLVGWAARTDLISVERTEELTRAQYASLRRLATLPAQVQVWPTHGAGSFCSAPPGAQRTSTIEAELATNPLLQTADENAFVSALLGSLGSYPPYFRGLAEVNRIGPPLLDGDPRLAPLSVDAVRSRVADGAVLVDARPKDRFAKAHVPGSISIPLRPVFASWLGWLAPADQPLVIVADADQDTAEIAWQAAKIGYHNIVGYLDGGLKAWIDGRQDAAALPLATAGHLDGRRVLDVRQRAEYESGHLPGAVNIELGDIAKQAGSLPDEPTAVMCGHGERAIGAASLLQAAGHHDVVVIDGGPADWVQATGRQLVTGT